MKRYTFVSAAAIVLWIAVVVVLFACFVGTVRADHCRIVRNNAVVIKSTGAVITPYAVPVAVPVQVATPYVYQHSGAQGFLSHSYGLYDAKGAQVYGQQGLAADAQRFERFLAWEKQQAASHVTPQALPQSLVQQNCVKCHTSNVDAREHFDMSGELTAEQRLAASRAILRGVMPKGKKIDDATRGNLLGELLEVDAAPAKSQQPTPAAEATPPPPPQPEANQQSQPQP